MSFDLHVSIVKSELLRVKSESETNNNYAKLVTSIIFLFA